MVIKKWLSLSVAALLALSVAGCGGAQEAAPSSSAPEAAPASSEAAPSEAASSATESTTDGTYEIAMITDLGTIDDRSFNQGTWEGVKKYAEEKNISHKYYKPVEGSDDAYLSAIDLAVKGGAKVVVTPGFLFETPVFNAQTAYPDVTFILLDGFPKDAEGNVKVEKNAVGFVYAEEQPGFLAGYAAVKEGFTNLGFLGGMAVPAVVRYGYGYVQGAEYAAQEMGLADGAITVNYHYTGGFDATPEAQTLAASWYQNGTQVIFGCGGAVGNSAMAAAEAAGAKVIGVDVDQSSQSETVISSAMKYLSDSVYSMLDKFYTGSFPGGQTLTFTAADDMLGLPMSTSKFEKFTQADYDAVYAKLKNDTDGLSSSIKKDTDVGSAAELPVTKVKVNVVE